MRIELYLRNPNGQPTGNLIRETYSNAQGFYRFQNLPIGEYDIYFIGDPNYVCISGMDLTLEAGEPTTNSEVYFIQMNVVDNLTEDADNLFVIKEI